MCLIVCVGVCESAAEPFSSLSSCGTVEFMRTLCSKLRSETYMPGHTITEPGDFADCMYMISRGDVEIEYANADTLMMTEGALFGETALSPRFPATRKRTSTATAMTYVEMFILKKEEMISIYAQFPDLRKDIDDHINERLRLFPIESECSPQEAQGHKHALKVASAIGNAMGGANSPSKKHGKHIPHLHWRKAKKNQRDEDENDDGTLAQVVAKLAKKVDSLADSHNDNHREIQNLHTELDKKMSAITAQLVKLAQKHKR